MALNYKQMKNSIVALAEYYHLPEEVASDTVKEAIAKGYRKHIAVPDINIRVAFNDDKEQIELYQQRTVVAEEPEDDDLEISLAKAKETDPNVVEGDVVEEAVPYDESYAEFGRGDVTLVKNVLRQKTREAQKQEIFDKFIDQVGELTNGVVDKVEDRFVIVNLNGTEALMPKSGQMPQEYYREGDRIKVIITEVSKDTKGSQLLVSRSDPQLVKRLFEQEVPEIYDGTVEIKAIAREAGERTKMAVLSHKEEVDPIGACIGPRGSRVQVVINELKGEKIDIFQWSDDVEDLIGNSLSPAVILGVIPGKEENSLIVVVGDDQLSLAIGRKGNNVRLAVNLTGRKIDIKTASTLENDGIDWKSIAALQKEKSLAIKKAAEELRAQKEKEAEEQRNKQALEVARAAMAKAEAETKAMEEKEEPKDGIEDIIEEVPLFEEVKPSEKEVAEEGIKPKAEPKKRKNKIHVVASDYVSKFEKLADATKVNQAMANSAAKPVKKAYRHKDEEDHKVKNKDLLQDKEYEIKPEYSDAELAEIKEKEEEEENDKYNDDVDYDEFDEYYDNGEK